MVQNLEQIIVDQQDTFESKKDWVRREIDFDKYLKTPRITVISGLRRVGKSTLLRQFAEKIEEYFYVNFDDERLIHFTVEDFAELMLVFQKQSSGRTILIDEVQNIVNWERFVRRIHDEGYKIFITGSNAKLLSSDLGTHLTGRYLKVELYPFSFKEFLPFHNFNPEKKLTTKNKASLLVLFDDYLKTGGMPEYLKFKDEEFLSRTYEDIIFRDIIARYKLKEIKQFRQLAHYLFSNFTGDVSYNSIKNILGAKSPISIRNHIGYLEESYLVFELLKYDYSLKKQHINQKKIYVIDNGIRSSVAFQFSEDRGKLLENLVFVELKRRNNLVYMHKSKQECDFILEKKHKIVSAIQVCYDLNETNKKREFGGIESAMDQYGLDSGLVLTYNQIELETLKDGRKIYIEPTWKWLISV